MWEFLQKKEIAPKLNSSIDLNIAVTTSVISDDNGSRAFHCQNSDTKLINQFNPF